MSEPTNKNTHAIDLLDFEGQDLYFDEPIDEQVAAFLEKASNAENTSKRITALVEANTLAPDDLNVIVALYRFYYFQHNFNGALSIATRAMQISGRQLNIPCNWQELETEDVERAGESNMTMLRFYLWALKGEAYLLMRLGRFEDAIPPLQKLCDLDHANRLNCKPLLALAEEKRTEYQNRRTGT